MTTAAGNTPAGLIDTAQAWQSAAAALAGAGRLALDLEADGFHRYPERVCLIQVALDDDPVLLLDPLAIDDLGPLKEILGDPHRTKVFHAADYDVRSMARDFGIRIKGLFDTAIAAQFLGATRTGLANVLARFQGVKLDKPKRLQRLDWSQRPLPADAVAYAADDVAHLLPLADTLAAELQALGRREWVREECRRLELVRFAPERAPDEAFLRVPGARSLSSASRAVLKELCVFREREALRIGRPPHWVLPNRVLLALASDPDLPLEAAGAPRRWRGHAAGKLKAALRRGKEAPPEPWPRSRGRNPWTSASRERLAALKSWRSKAATQLGLDPGLVWPMGHLKRMALEPDAGPRDLDTGEPPMVRAWQWRVLGDDLRSFHAQASGSRSPPGQPH